MVHCFYNCSFHSIFDNRTALKSVSLKHGSVRTVRYFFLEETPIFFCEFTLLCHAELYRNCPSVRGHCLWHTSPYACIRPISPSSGKRYNPLPNNPRPTSTVPWLRDFLHICRDYLYFKAPSTNSRHAVTGSDQCIPSTDVLFPYGHAFQRCTALCIVFEGSAINRD